MKCPLPPRVLPTPIEPTQMEPNPAFVLLLLISPRQSSRVFSDMVLLWQEERLLRHQPLDCGSLLPRCPMASRCSCPDLGSFASDQSLLCSGLFLCALLLVPSAAASVFSVKSPLPPVSQVACPLALTAVSFFSTEPSPGTEKTTACARPHDLPHETRQRSPHPLSLQNCERESRRSPL
jgi:hypothetical protein